MKHRLFSLGSISDYFRELQDNICLGIEAIDMGPKFREDQWTRQTGGGGRSRIIENGRIIEKGGVNFSHVWGELPEKVAAPLGIAKGMRFDATGISIVLHPGHPHIPIIHMNLRYFELSDATYWFGGGIDVTPIYIEPGQAYKFHQNLKELCDQFDPKWYPEYKSWCDSYFFLPHRKETRGIGGIFFDRLDGQTEEEKSMIAKFVYSLGARFLPIFGYFVAENEQKQFGNREREWQLLRRSRYAEFNLLWDKGTKFGLETDGRTESILMSMPPLARWVYDFQAEEDSPEARTLAWLKPVDWLGIDTSGTRHQKLTH